MRFYNLLIFLLQACSWFIAIATFTYFTLAYGWGFMIWALAITVLIMSICMALYFGMRKT